MIRKQGSMLKICGVSFYVLYIFPMQNGKKKDGYRNVYAISHTDVFEGVRIHEPVKVLTET